MECTIDSNSTLGNKLLSLFVNFFRLLSKFKPLQHILLLYLLWMDILTIYPHATLLPTYILDPFYEIQFQSTTHIAMHQPKKFGF